MNRSASGSLLALAALLFVGPLGGCAVDEGGGGDPPPADPNARRAAGDACQFNEDCESNVCNTAMPEGLCTAPDCASCAEGFGCAPSHLGNACFKRCVAHAECRAGYQCFDGACIPGCAADADCSRNYFCSNGYCEKRPPIVTGNCTVDADCPSKICNNPENKCSRACAASTECGTGEFCVMRLFFSESRTTGTRAVCSPSQPGAALGESCSADKDCQSGMCYLGLCTELCNGTGCATGLTCQSSQYVGADGVKPARVCLPAQGTLETDFVFRNFGSAAEVVPVPQNTASFSIVALTERPANTPAVLLLDAPDRKRLYSSPQSTADFYRLPIRYYPDSGVSTMLVPNTPAVTLQAGPYEFIAGDYDGTGYYTGSPRVKLFHKLAPNGVVSAGRLNLNFHIASMRNHPCGNISAANAATELKASIDTIKRIYAKAKITIGTVTYRDLTTTTLQSIDTRNETQMSSLFSSSAGTQGRSVNIFLVRSLSPQGVLGVSGGIPGPPLHGTANSGVVATMEARCHGVLGNVLAHEVGHFLGLFHNVEQDGNQDAIADSTSSTQNLMYWNEQGGEELSGGQGFVMLRNPLVE